MEEMVNLNMSFLMTTIVTKFMDFVKKNRISHKKIMERNKVKNAKIHNFYHRERST